jgi:hypothetical protein
MLAVSLLICVCACDGKPISDFEIGQWMLDKGETLHIPERGLTFLRFAPHFLPGRVWFDGNSSNFTHAPPAIRPGGAYVFDKEIRVVYDSRALAPLPVTVWKIRSGCRHAIFFRYPAGVRVTYRSVPVVDEVCYFFEFLGTPTVAWEYINRLPGTPYPLRLVHMEDERYRIDLLEGGGAKRTSNFFAIVVRETDMDFSFEVSSASSRVEWTDEDTTVLDCRGPSGACANDTFVASEFHFWQQKRRLPTAVCVSVVIIVAVALGFMAGLLFWNAGSEFSLGSGMKPLGKVLAMPFT